MFRTVCYQDHLHVWFQFITVIGNILLINEYISGVAIWFIHKISNLPIEEHSVGYGLVTPRGDVRPGARFTNDFLPAIQTRWKLRLAVIPLLAIRSQQIFAHATTAQPCTKFCSDHCISIEMRVKRNFHRIWIAMEKPLVKRGPRPVRCQAITLTSVDLLTTGQILVNFESKYNNFHSRKCMWKCRL